MNHKKKVPERKTSSLAEWSAVIHEQGERDREARRKYNELLGELWKRFAEQSEAIGGTVRELQHETVAMRALWNAVVSWRETHHISDLAGIGGLPQSALLELVTVAVETTGLEEDEGAT